MARSFLCLRAAVWVSLLLVSGSLPAGAKETVATLRLVVSDQTGAVIPGAICLLTGVAHDSRRATTAANGTCAFSELDAGTYRVEISRAGFRPIQSLVNVKTNASTEKHLVLHLFESLTTIKVSADDEVLDSEPAVSKRVDANQIRSATSAQVSRELVDIVRSQPGWLVEANGVLHPRGSEYQTQYIVDGIPQLDNHSVGYAPTFDTADLDSMFVQTGGYPASIGRKLGGVVELESSESSRTGWHGTAELEGGSFSTAHVAAEIGLVRQKTAFQIAANGDRTNYYLDPPTLDNFTNHGSTNAIRGFLSHQFDNSKRLRFTAREAHSGFDVPNELEQQLAGQLQSRAIRETSATAAYEQALSPNVLLQLRAMGHDVSASLDSNPQSTPIQPWQRRNAREFYSAIVLTAHRGRHSFSTGTDLLHTGLHEDFRYQITDPDAFDADVLPNFSFAEQRSGNEFAFFAQDRIALGPLTVNVGVRWDYYNLLVRDNAWSPRIAASYVIKPLGLVLRGSYDRAFNTPATENLLLASSAVTRQVTSTNLILPVPASRGNFYEVGASKLIGRLRVDVQAFRRDFTNFADDDVFLNTGISFPVAFASANIEGIEASLHLPQWRRFAFGVNYSNLSGRSQLPITGGLFLDADSSLLSERTQFRISQDQRNTVSSYLEYHPWTRLWFGTKAWYGSGLPVELEDDDASTSSDPRILSRVNFASGRLRPSYSVDVNTGVAVWRKDTRSLDAQFAVMNISNQVNVINFSGLFSGTAIAPGRSASARIRYQF